MSNNLNIHFEVDSLITLVKKMNQARVNLLNETIHWQNLYGNVSLLDWNGGTRQSFHNSMFGEQDNNGIIRVIGDGETNDGKKGLCVQLNDLLYNLEMYIIKVVREDSGGNIEIGLQQFNADISNSPVVNNFVFYNQINGNSISFTVKVWELFQTYKSRVPNFYKCVNELISSLKALQQNGWNDDVINEMLNVIQSLNRCVSSINSMLDVYIEAYSDRFMGLRVISSQSKNEISSSTTNVSNVNFD